jgi:hypothetical protein
MLVNRSLEDFVTWVDTSARKRTIMKYNDEVSNLPCLDACAKKLMIKLDDFELM